MALDATKWEIQNDKDIRYIGPAHGVSGANYVTGIELHRWLQDLADDSGATPDDFMSIIYDTPTNKLFTTIIELINGYNIDDTTAEYVYDASIIQDNNNVIYDGIQVVSNAGAHIEIIQNGSLVANDFWNSIPFGSSDKGINPDPTQGVSHRFMLKVRSGGSDIDGRRIIAQTREFGFTYSEFRLAGGTSRGVNVVPITYNADSGNTTPSGTVAGWTTIANLTEGYALIDVDNDTIDEPYYSEWDKDIYTIGQFFERIKYLTRRGSASTLYGLNGELLRGVTHDITIDGGTGTWDDFEPVSWTGGTGQMLAVNNTTASSATKMYIQLLTGVAPTDNQVITGGSSGATNTVNVTIVDRDVPTKNALPLCGQFTGVSLSGAYGFGIEALDLAASDKVVDLGGSENQPPNYVTFTVNGLFSTEDSLLVAPLGYRFNYDSEASGPFVVGETLTFTSPAGTAKLVALIDLGATGEMVISEPLSGSVPTDNSGITGGTSSATASVNGTPVNSINLGQLTSNGLVNGATITSIVVNETIPTDTPATGTIRIQRANGVYTKHSYTAYSGSTFTIGSTDFSTNNIDDDANIFISYIDKVATSGSESFVSIFNSARNLFVRDRDGGTAGDMKPIKTFESSATLSSTGGSITVIRTSDE
jgi:hypothetical protein